MLKQAKTAQSVPIMRGSTLKICPVGKTRTNERNIATCWVRLALR
jgi:hypothetical protein